MHLPEDLHEKNAVIYLAAHLVTVLWFKLREEATKSGAYVGASRYCSRYARFTVAPKLRILLACFSTDLEVASLQPMRYFDLGHQRRKAQSAR